MEDPWIFLGRVLKTLVPYKTLKFDASHLVQSLQPYHTQTWNPSGT